MRAPVSIKQVVLINLLTLVLIASAFMVYRVVALPDNSLKSSLSSPEVLSYQGSLVDSEGSPVSGTVDIVFRLYNSPTDPTALWAESYSGLNAVEVENGLFDVLLGSLTPIPASAWNETELYLGIQVGSDSEMSPREAINLLPPQITSNSLDASVLKNQTMGIEPFHSYKFQFSDSKIIEFFNRGTGIHTNLDPEICLINNEWCCNVEDTICIKRNPSGEDILALRMNDNHSPSCWLVHSDDDLPASNSNLTYSTDGDGQASPFPTIGNVFYFMRPGNYDIAISQWATYQILCLDW